MKILRVLIAAMLVMMLSACDSEKTSTVEFDAKAFAEILLKGDASSLYDTYSFTDEMMEALGEDGLGLIQTQLDALGELEEIEEPKVSEAQGYTVYSVPCKHSYQNFDLVISVDQDGKIAGIVMGNYSNEEAADLPFLDTETVTFGDEYKISGTLTTPHGETDYPCVIMLSGSGPNDRDETIGPNKPFRDIAEGLAQNGIATLRFDKRTYLYPKEVVSDVDFTVSDEYVIDAIAAYDLLKERDDISDIYLLGHSLGGQILPLVARDIDIKGLIYMAAPARDLITLIKDQISYLETFEGNDLSSYKEEIARLEDLDALADDEQVMGAYKAYWKDILNYDQLEAAKDITVPQLFLQGEEDYQVTMEDMSLWKENIKDGIFISYPSLTHIFMEGDLDQGPSAYMQKGKVAEDVIEDISAFITETR